MRTVLKSAAMVFVIMTAVTPVLGADFHVTKTADTNDGACTPGDCSLREAVIAANASPDADTIHIPAGTYILLIPGKNENAAATGDLDITGSVTLVGAGMKDTIITAAGEIGIRDRVFHVMASHGEVRFENLGIWGGYVPYNQIFDKMGGGVLIEYGDSYFFRCHIYRNTADLGGGVCSVRRDQGLPATVFTECLIERNEASFNGGGVWATRNISFNRSTLTDNRAATSGGGLSNIKGYFSVENSTFYKNSAPVGSEMALEESLGLFKHSTLVATSAFIPMNPSVDLQNGSAGFYNSIVWGSCNASGGGRFISDGRNIGAPLRNCGCDHPTDLIVDSDPGLLPLGQYGGATPTAPPWGNSPAIDRSLPIVDSPETDQRGVSRPQEGDGLGSPDYDIGAVEYRNFLLIWDPVLEFQNDSDQACDAFKNGVMRRAKVALLVMDVGDSEPRFWDELVFDGSIGPGKSESIRFDWPLAKGTPSGFAKLFWTLELVMENPETGAGTSQPTAYSGPGPPVPPDPTPPDPTPPDPTPPGPPRPKTFSVWAFDGKDPNFRGRPPRVPVAVDEEHTRVKFYLFGEECPDTPVGKVYFHLVKD